MSSDSPSIVVDLFGLLNSKKEGGVGPLIPQPSSKPRTRPKRTKKSNSSAINDTVPLEDCVTECAPEEPVVSVATNSTVTETKTNGLSNDWKKIFGTTRKAAPSSPKKSVSTDLLRKNGANSPKRGVRGSPKRRSAPNSPRRTNSPKRLNSSIKGVSQQLLKQSLNHSLQRCLTNGTTQSMTTNSSRLTFDTAPFTEMVHVQQKDHDDPFWHLSPYHSAVPLREVQQPEVKRPSGNIPLSHMTECGTTNTIPNVHFELCNNCEREAALSQLCQNHPQTDIRGLFSHYHSLTIHTAQKRHHSLKCSIRVKQNDKGCIEVDRSFYAGSLPPVIPGEHMQSEVWSDVYRPRKTNDIIGNRLASTQLRDWLRVWKEKCTCSPPSSQSSASKRRSKPLQSKSKQNNSSASSLFNEKDDDFVSPETIRVKRRTKKVLSKVTSDSESEDDCDDDSGGVCAAALVCGPHGCGKTAGVYAIAEELGFKVYEVNSSSVRNKAQLSSLREATLSHHVTVGEKPLAPSPSLLSGGGLMSFFQRLPKQPATAAKKKSASKKSESVLKESKSVTLESTTVILLDEVDVLFESDRGFWTAVNELLSVTKRPFIMTCSSADFNLDCDHIKIVFETPPIADVSLHLQVLTLVHGVSISAQSAQYLVKSFNCDLRKILNFLHTNLSGNHLSAPKLPSFKPHPSPSTSHMETDENHNSQSTLVELRKAFDQAELVASVDVLTTNGMSAPQHPHSPWWRKTPMDSLVDELSDDHVIQSHGDTPIYLHSLFQDHSHSNWDLEEYHRTRDLHSSQRKCAQLFSHQMWMLSRVPFVTEGLPFIRMVCDAEDVRQSSNTSRRFRHYFKSFPVNLCDLQNFNEISKYL